MMTRSNDRFLLERRILPSIGIAVFLFTLLATYFSYREFVLLRDLPDLFIFESAFWNTLHGRPLYNFYEFGNHLGTHFSPFLFLLVPIYALWQRPLLLIMLQALVLGSAAFPLFFIALKILGQKWAAFFVALAYLSYAPVFGAANYGFHEDAFVPLCLFWLFYAYLYNKKKLYWLFLILALGCKENVAPGLAIFGLYLAVRGEHRRIGIYTFTVSVVWFIVAVFAVMPAIKGVPVSEGMLRYRFSGEIGHSIGEIMQNFFKRPGFFFGYAFQAHKCAYLLKLFLPLVFLPLGSPIFLLAIMPALAQNLLYKYPQGTSLASQYSVQMVPYLFYGALMTIAALARLCEKRGVPGIKAQNLLAAVLLLGCIVSAFTTEVFTRSVYVRDAATLSEREVKTALRLGQMIPPDASLAASGYLPHHFARRKVIFYVNASIVKIFPFDYVLYYYKGTDLLRADPDTRRIISEDYEVEAGKGRFTLFRRKQIPYTPQQRSILDTLPR